MANQVNGWVQKMSGRQVRSMPDEIIALAVRQQVELMEQRAREGGADPDDVMVMVIGEWITIGPEDL